MNERDDINADFDQDDELRAMLRGSDPARSLPPADQAALAHLLEDIMSTDLEVRPAVPDEGTRATHTHGRNRLTWLVAAAAAVVIAGAGGFAVSGLAGNDADPPSASTTTDPGTDSGTDAGTDLGVPVAGATTELTAGAAPARCAVPSATLVGTSDQAFSGTVTAIEGDTVTIQTTDVYTGEVGETVVVSAPSPQFSSLIQATKFQVGGSYLVSASGGMVSVCGLSGKATGELRSLYDQAFVR